MLEGGGVQAGQFWVSLSLSWDAWCALLCSKFQAGWLGGGISQPRQNRGVIVSFSAALEAGIFLLWQGANIQAMALMGPINRERPMETPRDTAVLGGYHFRPVGEGVCFIFGPSLMETPPCKQKTILSGGRQSWFPPLPVFLHAGRCWVLFSSLGGHSEMQHTHHYPRQSEVAQSWERFPTALANLVPSAES